MKNTNSLRQIFFNLLLFLSAYYIGLTFIAASLDKILDPYTFSSNILNYEIMPYWAINLSAIILPWIEFICGFLLILSIISIVKSPYIKSVKKVDFFSYIDISNNIIILLLLWFVFILAVAHIKGLDIDCGCGLGEKTLPLDRLKEDIYLLVITFFIKFRHGISKILYVRNNIK